MCMFIVHCAEAIKCYFCMDVIYKCFQFPTFLPSVRRKIHPFLFSATSPSRAKYFSTSEYFPPYPSPLWAKSFKFFLPTVKCILNAQNAFLKRKNANMWAYE